MPKKQKQKKSKTNGRKTKQELSVTDEKIIQPVSVGDPVQKEIKKKPGEPESLTVKKSASQKKFYIDPYLTGMVIFSFGVLFVLLLVWGMQFGVGSGPKTLIQKNATPNSDDNSNEAIKQIETRVEALDGTLREAGEIHHPIAVMFDNHSDARPQSHLQSASVVYETLVEGSITRFMGIFDKGIQDKIGPIRSARPYFTQWVDPLDATYVHEGGSPEALLKILEYGIKDTNRGQYYSRDHSRSAPHNLYTTSELIMRAIRDNNWETSTDIRHWKFAEDPKKGLLADGGTVDLHFSGNSIGSLVRWEYIPETMRYKRFQAGVSHEDTSTGSQLTTKTIIVQIIPPIVSIGDKGRLTLDITGEGTAHILFDGKRIEGTWKKTDVVSRTVFYDDDGNEMTFPRGNMFVEVIPSDRAVTFE